jgi:hypothetical protein
MKLPIAVMAEPLSIAESIYSVSNNEAPFNWYCPPMLEDLESSSHRKSPNGNTESRR